MRQVLLVPRSGRPGCAGENEEDGGQQSTAEGQVPQIHARRGDCRLPTSRRCRPSSRAPWRIVNTSSATSSVGGSSPRTGVLIRLTPQGQRRAPISHVGTHHPARQASTARRVGAPPWPARQSADRGASSDGRRSIVTSRAEAEGERATGLRPVMARCSVDRRRRPVRSFDGERRPRPSRLLRADGDRAHHASRRCRPATAARVPTTQLLRPSPLRPLAK